MTDIFIAKRVVDYIGLLARGIPDATLPVHPNVQPTLALLQAMTADGAILVQGDNAGNLLVNLAPGIALAENLTQWGGGIVGAAVATGDGASAASIAPKAYAILGAYNNAGIDRVRSASAANQAAALGIGVIQSAPPGNVPAFSAPALGAQASASRVAGGAGVRHICTGYEIIVSCQAAPLVGQLLVNLRDGATGAGAILKTWAFEIQAAAFAAMIISVSGKSIVGSAATAMTLESSAAYAAVGVSVAFDSFDAS